MSKPRKPARHRFARHPGRNGAGYITLHPGMNNGVRKDLRGKALRDHANPVFIRQNEIAGKDRDLALKAGKLDWLIK